MKELHLFYAPGLPEDTYLPHDEATHALRVLRMKPGEALMATDGRGHFYNTVITVATAKACQVEVKRVIDATRPLKGTIHLVVAPTKHMERTEWMAEKVTEIGVDSITFVDCRFSERHVVKTERVERIVHAAMKQSHKAWCPVVEEMVPFSSFLQRSLKGQKFIAHCYDMADLDPQAAQKGALSAVPSPFLGEVAETEGDAWVLIGPEGDFCIEEVDAARRAGFIPISLGPSRLRTETAAMAAVHILNITKATR
jgi:16S rRNA (uracil1498-N3)-methyltransferase